MKIANLSTKLNPVLVLGERCERTVKWLALGFMVFAVAALTGCASIVSGTQQSIKISSDPSAAHVKVEKLVGSINTPQWEGETPATLKLSRNGSYLVSVSLPGYQKQEIPISAAGMNNWVWGNIIFGGIFGVIIDACDGAAKNLEPGEINVKLVTVTTSKANLPAGVYTVLFTATPDGKIHNLAFPLKSL